MDSSEKIAFDYLLRQGFEDVRFEPDGNVSPDFLVDGRIAVEVRRLNQNEQTPSGRSLGFEEVAIPLGECVGQVLESLGPPTAGASWFLDYSFKRPLAPWKQLKRDLRACLMEFRDGPEHQQRHFTISTNFDAEIRRAKELYPTFFVLGGYSDDDAGGWVLPELERNLFICVTEKTNKVRKVREKYPEWWLVLVDYISYGLSEFDREHFRKQVQRVYPWSKIILVAPLNPKRGFEV